MGQSFSKMVILLTIMITFNGNLEVSTVVITSFLRNCLLWFVRKNVPKPIEVRIANVQATFKVMEPLL